MDGLADEVLDAYEDKHDPKKAARRREQQQAAAEEAKKQQAEGQIKAVG